MKKAEIERHVYSCGSKLYNCIDCNKEFRDDEYKLHIKCLTESERYESKSSYVTKANKGELKQNAWLEKVANAVSVFRGSPRAKTLLEKLTDFPNVPRKKPKFMNFMRNSFRSYGVTDAMLNEIWTVIEKMDAAQAQPQPQAVQKRPLEKVEEESVSVTKKVKEDEEAAPEFDWLAEIRQECAKKDKHEIKLNKLEKKIFKKYKKSLGTVEDQEDNDQELFSSFQKKFFKKLKKLSSSVKLTTNGQSMENVDASQLLEQLKSSSLETSLVTVQLEAEQ